MENVIYARHWKARLKEGAKPCAVCEKEATCFTADVDEERVFSNITMFCDEHRPTSTEAL